LKRATFRLAVLIAVSAAVFAATTGAASAKPTCGQQVIDDWYGSKTGQLSKTYPIHCYRDALKIVGHETDLEVYSNAHSDILRAMQLAIAAGKSNGTGGGPSDPTASVETADALPSFLGGPDAKNGGHPPTGEEPYATRGRPTTGPVVGVLQRGSSPSSVPVPAIVLGAIAALLLMLGSAAYIARRRQQRRQTFRPRHANGRSPS
jgi:hypothetical protein